MSFKLTAQVFDIQVGNPLRKMVLLKLADQANDAGECFPSYDSIAKACEISKRSVISHIKWLSDNGFLWIEKRYDKQAKKNLSNIYHITLDKGVISKQKQGCNSCTSESPALGGGANGSLPSESPALGGSESPAPKPITLEPINESNKKNKQKKFDAKMIDLPGWVNLDAWLGFVEMRTLIKKPMTERAATMILNKLESFRANGYDPNQLLDNSTRNNWQDIYQPKGETHGDTHSKANTGNTSANYGAMLDQQKQAYQALANAS